MWKKRAVALWRVRTLALCVLLCVLLIPLTPGYPPIWLAVTLLVGASTMACAYIRLYAHTFSLRFTPEKIEILSGVFFRRSILLPAQDTIFTDLRSTPVERRLGLCRVRICGRGKVIRIFCLPRTQAEKIQHHAEELL